MIAVWTDQAKEGKNHVAEYIRNKFGLKYKRKFIQDVDRTVRMLMRSPNVASFEELLSDLPSDYRSIVVNHLSKIIYRIHDDVIYIVDFWDVRRDPKTLASQIK